MANQTIPQTADIIETLLYFDEPQILLLKTDRNNKMLAVAINKPDSDVAFFACEARDKPYEKYMQGKADLRYVFENSMRGKYYFFDLAKVLERKVKLTEASKDQSSDNQYWPQIGFFSRSHTSDFGSNSTVGSGVQLYHIDGKWGPTDFSYFYSKVADLYAIFAIFGDSWGDLKQDARDGVFEIVKDKMWRGGGSYVGFYDQLMEKVQGLKLPTLEVKKIEYASPGNLVLGGDADVLTDVRDIVQVMADKKDDLDKSYSTIRGILRAEKLLKKGPGAKFSNEGIRKLVKTSTDKFIKEMGLDCGSVLYEASNKKTLVYAKLVLSIYRRANEVYAFHAEGRVQSQ